MLQNCCTELEARAAGFSGLEMSDPEALRRQMLLDLPRSQCTIGAAAFFTGVSLASRSWVNLPPPPASLKFHIIDRVGSSAGYYLHIMYEIDVLHCGNS